VYGVSRYKENGKLAHEGTVNQKRQGYLRGLADIASDNDKTITEMRADITSANGKRVKIYYFDKNWENAEGEIAGCELTEEDVSKAKINAPTPGTTGGTTAPATGTLSCTIHQAYDAASLEYPQDQNYILITLDVDTKDRLKGGSEFLIQSSDNQLKSTPENGKEKNFETALRYDEITNIESRGTIRLAYQSQWLTQPGGGTTFLGTVGVFAGGGALIGSAFPGAGTLIGLGGGAIIGGALWGVNELTGANVFQVFRVGRRLYEIKSPNVKTTFKLTGLDGGDKPLTCTFDAQSIE